ncbi:MAG: single-stranded DNA-binding protein [Clostridium sp.]|uniref:single-stranded DNA-binding protein n=2 Tax=Clostridium sp. TaxID=1506 RepID=UPI00305DE767
MNKVVLIGRLTKDPELKFTPGTGTAVATFTIAVNRRFKKEGQPEADFIPVVVWGKQAESTANYMSKGKLLSVAGRIETRSYEAKDGGRRYVTEVVADEVSFLEWGGNKTSGMNTGENSQSNSSIPSDYFGGGDMTPIDDGEDMPF